MKINPIGEIEHNTAMLTITAERQELIYYREMVEKLVAEVQKYKDAIVNVTAIDPKTDHPELQTLKNKLISWDKLISSLQSDKILEEHNHAVAIRVLEAKINDLEKNTENVDEKPDDPVIISGVIKDLREVNEKLHVEIAELKEEVQDAEQTEINLMKAIELYKANQEEDTDLATVNKKMLEK